MPPLTPRVFGDRGRKRAEKLGIDPARLPPGQSPTVKFPVLTIGPDPAVPTASWAMSSVACTLGSALRATG